MKTFSIGRGSVTEHLSLLHYKVTEVRFVPKAEVNLGIMNVGLRES